MDALGFLLATDRREGDDKFTTEICQMMHDTEYDLIELEVGNQIWTFDHDQAVTFLECFENMVQRLGESGNGTKDKYQ